MATRANRAATAATKMGGNSKNRNSSIRLLHPEQGIDSDANQEAFRAGRHETLARHHNISGGSETEPEAPGVIEGTGYTPRHRAGGSWPEHVSDSFKITSPMIGNHRVLSARCTSEGEGLSPAVSWSGGPASAEEFVLVCEDMDAAGEAPAVHWLVYRIPANLHGLPEGAPDGDQIESVHGAPLQGMNSAGRVGWFAPELSRFEDWHHLRIRVYALEVPLRNLRPAMTKAELMECMKTHILEIGELICRYRRADFKAAG